MLASIAAAVLVLVCGVAEALVITQPTAVSVWTNDGPGSARIEWSLLPETSPPPATPFFDIYIRNGVGAMYSPSLNLLLASSVDSTTSTFLDVTDLDKFVPGPGYQLFFSDPANPATVYCDSDVFAIGSYEVNGPPPTSSSVLTSDLATDSSATSAAASSSATTQAGSSAASQTGDSSAVQSSASSGGATASSTSSVMITSVVATTSSTLAVPTTTTTTTSSRPGNGITAAPVPGGPDEQGFNLVGAAPRRPHPLGLGTVLCIFAAGVVAGLVPDLRVF